MSLSKIVIAIVCLTLFSQFLFAKPPADSFEAELQGIQRVRPVNEDEILSLIEQNEKLIEQYPEHSKISEAMLHLARLYASNAIPELTIRVSQKKRSTGEEATQWLAKSKESGRFEQNQNMRAYWAERSAQATELGSDTWLSAIKELGSSYGIDDNYTNSLEVFLSAEKQLKENNIMDNPEILARLDYQIMWSLAQLNRGEDVLHRYESLMERQMITKYEDRNQIYYAKSQERGCTDLMVDTIMTNQSFAHLTTFEKFTLLADLKHKYNEARLDMKVNEVLQELNLEAGENQFDKYHALKKAAQVKDQVEKKPTIQTAYVPDNPVEIIVTRDAEKIGPAIKKPARKVAALSAGSSAPASNFEYYLIIAGLFFFGAIACGYALKLRTKN